MTKDLDGGNDVGEAGSPRIRPLDKEDGDVSAHTLLVQQSPRIDGGNGSGVEDQAGSAADKFEL